MSAIEEELSVVYDDDFLRWVGDQADEKFVKEEWPKLKQAAEVHNYRGASKGKHNGVVPIRPTDKGLLKTLNKILKTKNIDAIKSKALPIKVVAHVPTGNRLVGLRFPDKRIVIYACANYAD
jgi:hypothetical protein